MLTWFLFRLSAIFSVVLFWNACIPSLLLDVNVRQPGLFWFVVAADAFGLAWVLAYTWNYIRIREGAFGKSVFAVFLLVFVFGNLSYLPMLFEWRAVERDPRAAFELMHEGEYEDWPFDFQPPGEMVASLWKSCLPVDELQFEHDIWVASSEERFGFWPFYEERTSSDMEVALYFAERDLDVNPKDGEAWAMFALVYSNAIDYGVAPAYEAIPTARNSLDKAFTYAPEANITRAAYGLVMQSHDAEGAESRLRQCIADSPEFAECHNLLGDLLRKTGRAEQAGDIYLEGLKRWPENGELHVSYALYLQETGQPKAAIEYLRKLASEQPDFPRAHWHLAVMLYEEGGDLDEAREHAVKALEMDPKIWNGEKLLLELLRPGADEGY